MTLLSPPCTCSSKQWIRMDDVTRESLQLSRPPQSCGGGGEHLCLPSECMTRTKEQDGDRTPAMRAWWRSITRFQTICVGKNWRRSDFAWMVWLTTSKSKVFSSHNKHGLFQKFSLHIQSLVATNRPTYITVFCVMTGKKPQQGRSTTYWFTA